MRRSSTCRRYCRKPHAQKLTFGIEYELLISKQSSYYRGTMYKAPEAKGLVPGYYTFWGLHTFREFIGAVIELYLAEVYYAAMGKGEYTRDV